MMSSNDSNDGPDSGEVESNRGELRRELNQENAGEA